MGGEGNHPVISAHRGLPSSRLFTDLDRLEAGDIFILHVLGDDLAYQVDQILTVLPTQTEELYIDKNKDYCTLMTCTPYGINTHRLLVRGVRTYLTPEETAQIEAETAGAVSNTGRIVKIVIFIVGAVLIVLLLSQIFVMILRRSKKK